MASSDVSNATTSIEMAAASSADIAAAESFQSFFELWVSEQNQKLQELISVSKRLNHISNNNFNGEQLVLNRSNEQVVRSTTTTADRNQDVNQLINRVIDHYEIYYRAKSRYAKHDVLSMLTPSWRSSLEDAFLWIGGWRPSMAFHLLYSVSGMQFEAHLAGLLRGLTTGGLADLSADQICEIDELQSRTISEEKKVTEKMAKHQETVADTSMVELSHVITELLNNDGGGGGEGMDERVESTLAPKEKGWVELLAKADDLRLRTLKGVLGILTPIQAVHFLIAAAELHLRLHDWGKEMDIRSGRDENGGGHH